MSHSRRTQRLFTVRSIGSGLVVGLVLVCVTTPDALALGSRSKRVEAIKLAPPMEGTHESGPWTYEYSIGQKGTRSEGYYGKLLYDGKEVPEPASANDFYETPWGPMYWVGQPPLLFGNHGWMTKPMGRGPSGEVLVDPAKLVGRVFTVQVKVLTSQELATPDRIEMDTKVLVALRPFELQEAHIQRNWFKLAQKWETLHDTKSWGHLEMRVAPSDPNRPLALEFRNTGGFTLTSSDQLYSLSALIPPAAQGDSKSVTLPPQVGAVRTIKCTLTPVVGDPLDLFLVCRVAKSRKLP